ncbi:MAG: hypothetical protein JO013_14460 [Alphaproteobacteria bacterium]|nr:hypothetical protein [Alphaproteobacteria bacterium]
MTKTTEIGRRGLIVGAAAAAGLTALAAPARATGLGRARGARPSLATAGADAWRAAVGTVFAAETDAGRVPLRLVAVDRLGSGPARPAGLARDHGFALSFALPGGARLPANRAYRLASADHKPVDVFFSSGTRQLTAIFN